MNCRAKPVRVTQQLVQGVPQMMAKCRQHLLLGSTMTSAFHCTPSVFLYTEGIIFKTDGVCFQGWQVRSFKLTPFC